MVITDDSCVCGRTNFIFSAFLFFAFFSCANMGPWDISGYFLMSRICFSLSVSVYEIVLKVNMIYF